MDFSRYFEFYNWDLDNPNNVSPILVCVLNGVKTRLLIDTGASVSVISSGFVNKYALLKISRYTDDDKIIKLNMVGGSSDFDEYIKPDIKIGRTLIGEHPFLLMDKTSFNSGGEIAYDGILGCDFLVPLGADINFSDFSFKLTRI